METYDVMTLPACELPRCAVMLVLDTSHSMYRGTALNDLTKSLRVFCETLGRETVSAASVEIAAVSMGDNLGLIAPFAPAANSPVAGLKVRPKGDTPIGGALRCALTALDAQAARWRSEGRRTVTPQLVILSDGVSTDDFAAEAAEIRRRVSANELCVRAIALGASADRAALATLAGTEVFDPLGADMPGAFGRAGVEVSRGYEREAAQAVVEAPAAAWNAKTYYVDGTNVAFWDSRRSGVQLEYVFALARFLKDRGVTYRILFDASTPYRLREKGQPGDEARYRQALKARPDVFVEVPGGQQADAFLLAKASSDPSSVVISNDRFRDRETLYPWVRDPSRHIGGMVLDGELCLPEPGWLIPLAATANA